MSTSTRRRVSGLLEECSASASTTSSTCPSRRSPAWSAAPPSRSASSPRGRAPTSRRASRASRPTARKRSAAVARQGRLHAGRNYEQPGHCRCCQSDYFPAHASLQFLYGVIYYVKWGFTLAVPRRPAHVPTHKWHRACPFRPASGDHSRACVRRRLNRRTFRTTVPNAAKI